MSLPSFPKSTLSKETHVGPIERVEMPLSRQIAGFPFHERDKFGTSH